jgi:prepilin-type N-terminal cleavage/methylation domain-containing protein
MKATAAGATAKDQGGQTGETGFTVLELTVVVVVLGILLAIGLPMLFGARGRASDVAAKSQARQAAIAQRSFLANNGTLGDASQIQGEEPSLKVDTLDPAATKVLGKVYVKVDQDVATLVARSAGGSCYWVRQPINGAATYAKADCASTPAADDFKSSW